MDEATYPVSSLRSGDAPIACESSPEQAQKQVHADTSETLVNACAKTGRLETVLMKIGTPTCHCTNTKQECLLSSSHFIL